MFEENLILFIYANRMVLKLPLYLKVKVVRVMKPEIEELFRSQNRKQEIDEAYMEISSKIFKKSSGSNGQPISRKLKTQNGKPSANRERDNNRRQY